MDFLLSARQFWCMSTYLHAAFVITCTVAWKWIQFDSRHFRYLIYPSAFLQKLFSLWTLCYTASYFFSLGISFFSSSVRVLIELHAWIVMCQTHGIDYRYILEGSHFSITVPSRSRAVDCRYHYKHFKTFVPAIDHSNCAAETVKYVTWEMLFAQKWVHPR